MHRFVFADWANQRPNPSASLVVPAVHMTNHMWSHWSSACRLMLCFGVSRIYMLGNGIYLLLYAKLFLLWTSEVDSDNCWSLTCTETELGASSLLRWMDLCSFQFFKAAYCTSVRLWAAYTSDWLLLFGPGLCNSTETEDRWGRLCFTDMTAEHWIRLLL